MTLEFNSPRGRANATALPRTMEAVAWSHYYGVVQKLSILVGMWPYMELSARRSRVVLWAANMLTVFVPQVAFQLTCRDIQCTFLSMTAYLFSIVILVKMYTFQSNISKMKEFTEHLRVDWKILETAEEREIMRSYASNSRQFSIIYLLYCFVTTFIFMSVSLVPRLLDALSPLNESRPLLLPYPGYYFVDSREYFGYIYWHSVVAWEVVVAALAAHDCMLVSYVEHVCSLFAVVGFRFEYLFRDRVDATKNIGVHEQNEMRRKRIVFLVHTHLQALELAEILENIFTVPLAIQLLINTVGMSISLLQVAHESGGLTSLKFALYIIGQLIHLLFLNLEGQKLLDHSLQTLDKIYNSRWYEMPVKLRKLLVLVMMKSLRPASLSAGKIYVFCMENFATVLQTSMSYFTVLSSI